MRVYAEDTAAGFVPAPGHIHSLRVPSIDCRVESAVLEGNFTDVCVRHFNFCSVVQTFNYAFSLCKR